MTQDTRPPYIVIQETNLNTLAYEVNLKLEEGYTCLGGISVASHYSGSTFYNQALVRNSSYGV